jgi:hypothetical protein
MRQLIFGTIFFLASAIVACTSNSVISNSSTTESQPTPVSSPSDAATTQAHSSFDETLYAFSNPDVKDLIKQGKYQSGLDHYTQVGQTAKKADGEDYESFFTGTPGNDIVQGFGKGNHAHFSGVKIEIVDKKDDPLPLRPTSLGKGEMDVLIGTKEGGNEFLLGSFITSVNPKAEPFYVGKGDSDYARIQNFTKTKDGIILAGEPSQYKIVSSAGNVRISTVSGDLIAIVENIDKLEVDEIVKEYGVFSMK